MGAAAGSDKNSALDARLADFSDYLRYERRLSPHTHDNYLRDLRIARDYCKQQQIGDWAQLDAGAVRRFAAGLHRKGQSASTIQRRLSALRALFRYLIREQYVANNPAQDIAAPKSEQTLPHVLNIEQAQQLLDAHPDNPLLRRDHAMFELLYSSGLRLAELVSLDLTNIDLEQGLVRVTGKGNRTRTVPVGRKALSALIHWLAARSEFASADQQALFTSRSGKRISNRTVQKRLAQWAQRQGLAEHAHPHMLRHSFASHMLESSGELRAIQELLGHADIATTQIYTHLDFQHLADVYDRAHPKARKRRE